MKHTISINWASGSLNISRSFDVIGDGELNVDAAIAAATGDPLTPTVTVVDLPLDVSALQSLFIVADQDLTLKTNSPSVPNNTITLAAGVPFFWQAGGAPLTDTGGTAITTDIVTLHVSNPAGATGLLQIRSLSDVTP